MTRSEEEIKKVIKMYELSGRRATQASKLLKKEGIEIRTPMIIKYWREENLEIRAQGERIREGIKKPKVEFDKEAYLEKYREIVKAYDRYDGRPSLAARSLPYSYNTIREVWELAGKVVKLGKY